MFATVEPLGGSELDRLITVLLNATALTCRAIEATDDPDAGGERIIGAVAKRLSAALACLAQLYSDDELGELTGALAHITLLLAEDLGMEDHFRPSGPGPGAPSHPAVA